MRLTVMVKLLPTEVQYKALEATLRRVNAACDYVSEVAWQTRTFGKYALQKKTYTKVKERFALTAQVVIRLLAKVADAYKRTERTKRIFRPLGAIAYDDRILSWREDSVSIWTVSGREKMSFVCDERTAALLGHRRGESDLVYRGGKWYLLATVEVEESPPGTPEDWLGVDLGVVNIAADSDGETYSGEQVEKSRKRYDRIRSRLQAAGTKSAKRHLKKLAKRERRCKRDTNHRISKRLVSKAKETTRGIRLEDLQGIRDRSTVRKAQRSRHSRWAFAELRAFITYKARRAGVAVEAVDPRNTSRSCSECGHCEKGNRKSRNDFLCKSCGYAAPADHNAAKNISAAVMQRIVSESGDATHAPSASSRDKPAALAVGS